MSCFAPGATVLSVMGEKCIGTLEGGDCVLIRGDLNGCEVVSNEAVATSVEAPLLYGFSMCFYKSCIKYD